jgi:hypothetical protein
MQVNFMTNTIHCYFCNKDYAIHQIFENLYYETSVVCPFDHIIGHIYDYEYRLLNAPCNYFYIYHLKGYCRCIQEECNCFGIDEECNYPVAK